MTKTTATPPTLKVDMLALREEWRHMPEFSCFWSSPDNPQGLRLTPTINPGHVYVDMVIARHLTGFPGIAHGGIAYTILDGLMSWYLMAHLGRGAVTREATVKYLRPLVEGRSYRFQVREPDGGLRWAPDEPVHISGNVVETAAADDPQARVHLLIEGEFILPSRRLAERLMGADVIAKGPDLFP